MKRGRMNAEEVKTLASGDTITSRLGADQRPSSPQRAERGVNGMYPLVLHAKQAWPGLRSIGMVEAARSSADQVTSACRYDIMSLPGRAQAFG